MKEKIDALLQLQKLDAALDAIRAQRGTFPERIERLNGELARLNGRLRNISDLVDEQQQVQVEQQEEKKKAESLLRTYREEQAQVSDSRAYDAINKDVLLQELRIQLAQKKSKVAAQTIVEAREEMAELMEKIKVRKAKLEETQEELNAVLQKNEKEEARLSRGRRPLEAAIPKDLLTIYESMRAQVKPPIVVTHVEGGVCMGCRVAVPLSEQMLVREQKRLIHCQHCHRLLTSVEEAA